MSTKKTKIAHAEAAAELAKLKTPTPEGMPWPFRDFERWPWVTELKMMSPPWFGGQTLLTKAERCLWWLADNAGDVPPVFGFRGVVLSNGKQHTLPRGRAIVGDISQELAKHWQAARAVEVLAFVYNLRGPPEWQRCRELLAAPTPEAIARALAIATDSRAAKWRLGYSAIEEPTEGGLRTLDEIRRAYPKAGRKGSVAYKVIGELYARPDDGHSIKGLAGPGGGAREGTKKALAVLADMGLAEQREAEWFLGPAAWKGAQ